MTQPPLSGALPCPDLEALDPVDSVLAFLSSFVVLEEEEQQVVKKVTRIVRYPKGTLLLGSGDLARESWLVIQGCVRVFHEAHGEEQTIALYTQFQPAIPPTYGTDEPSPVGFECLEDVVASASTREEEIRAFAEHPAFESVCRVLGEALMAGLQQSQIQLRTRTAEQRYLDLVARRPDLLQRVPQYHIASYLGIQPETLSRIRRRLSRRRGAGR